MKLDRQRRNRHGRDDVVLLSAEEYQRLRSLDRRAMHVSELTDEDLGALDAVKFLRKLLATITK